MAAAGLDPTRVVQVPIDFDRQSLAEALAQSGFDRCLRSVVIWEGVTNYLTAEAVDAVLRWASGLAPGSMLAFTYVDAAVLRDPGAFEGARKMMAAVARRGEAWTYGIDPEDLPSRLRALGLELVEDLGADDYRSRYWRGAPAGWHGYAFYRAALALVPPRAAA